jgi:hypothetical protein
MKVVLWNGGASVLAIGYRQGKRITHVLIQACRGCHRGVTFIIYDVRVWILSMSI